MTYGVQHTAYFVYFYHNALITVNLLLDFDLIGAPYGHRLQ